MLDQSYLDILDDIPTIRVRWVASVSSGVSSAVAAELVMNKCGKDNVDLVFADTLHENKDNYRFLADLESRWNKKIIRLTDGRTPEKVWEDRQIIPNDMLAPCTYELKLKLIIDYVKELRKQGFAVIMCVGFSSKDIRRNSPKAKNYPKWFTDRYPGRCLATAINWSESKLAYVEFPALWPEMKSSVDTVVDEWGIEKPIMYSEGYTSANCDGDCPKGGVKHWILVYKTHREVFLHRAEWERERRKDPIFSKYTILTRQVKGKRVNLTLDQLQAEIEAKETEKDLRKFELQIDIENDCTIIECGIGWDNKL